MLAKSPAGPRANRHSQKTAPLEWNPPLFGGLLRRERKVAHCGLSARSTSRGDATFEVKVMRIHLKALLVFGFCSTQVLAAAPNALAADLAVTPSRSARIHVIHHKRLMLRDYDGTPIVLGRYYPTQPVMTYDGTLLVSRSCRTYPVAAQTPDRLPYISRDGGCCTAVANSHLYPYARPYL